MLGSVPDLIFFEGTRHDGSNDVAMRTGDPGGWHHFRLFFFRPKFRMPVGSKFVPVRRVVRAGRRALCRRRGPQAEPRVEPSVLTFGFLHVSIVRRPRILGHGKIGMTQAYKRSDAVCYKRCLMQSDSRHVDMTVQAMMRCALGILMVGIVAGCASPGPLNKCKWSPSSCMYEGSYEPGEARYAEEEARRLNRASIERLRGR